TLADHVELFEPLIGGFLTCRRNRGFQTVEVIAKPVKILKTGGDDLLQDIEVAIDDDVAPEATDDRLVLLGGHQVPSECERVSQTAAGRRKRIAASGIAAR